MRPSSTMRLSLGMKIAPNRIVAAEKRAANAVGPRKAAAGKSSAGSEPTPAAGVGGTKAGASPPGDGAPAAAPALAFGLSASGSPDIGANQWGPPQRKFLDLQVAKPDGDRPAPDWPNSPMTLGGAHARRKQGSSGECRRMTRVSCAILRGGFGQSSVTLLRQETEHGRATTPPRDAETPYRANAATC